MALKDVKQYYYTMQAQYLQLKEDLVDYDEAFKAGYVTEDKLAAVKEEYALLEANYQRLSYIMYLLEIPNRTNKKDKFNKANSKLLTAFDLVAASEKKVVDENKSVLNHIKQELNKLTNK